MTVNDDAYGDEYNDYDEHDGYHVYYLLCAGQSSVESDMSSSIVYASAYQAR